MEWASDASCRSDPLFTADPAPSIRQQRRRNQALVEVCLECPVLAECRDYARRHTWAGVVVAGWAAPHGNAVRYAA